MSDALRILSLGAGVQSTTMLVMAAEGSLNIDAAVFADTQWEPKAVYKHLWIMAERYGDEIPILIDTAGNLRESATAHGRQTALPHFIKRWDGKQGRSNRSCTFDYKTSVVRRVARSLGGGHGRAKRPVVMLLGYSTDEWQRMADSDTKYITHEYPLIDRNMTRTNCNEYLLQHGIVAPRSACIGCPNHGNAYWRNIPDDELEDAADADALTRKFTNLKDGLPYIHRSMLPLREAVALVRAQGQIFADDDEFECGSGCGT